MENVLLADHPELQKSSSTSQILLPPPLISKSEHSDHHHVEKRSESDDESEDYSMEEMKMMHDYEGDEEEHEMSVVDDHGNSTKDWHIHINLFGEVVHNTPDQVILSF